MRSQKQKTVFAVSCKSLGITPICFPCSTDYRHLYTCFIETSKCMFKQQDASPFWNDNEIIHYAITEVSRRIGWPSIYTRAALEIVRPDLIDKFDRLMLLI